MFKCRILFCENVKKSLNKIYIFLEKDIHLGRKLNINNSTEYIKHNKCRSN